MKLTDLLPKELRPAESQDAIDILTADHDKVKALFGRFDEIKDGRALKEKQRIVTEICNELTVHATVEEQVFYPAVRAAIDDDDLMNEAQIEHNTAKDLIAQLEAMTADDEMLIATVTVLKEYINHHVREEQNDMFPKAKKADLDLAELGQQITERKAELKGAIGAQPAKRRATHKAAAKRRRQSRVVRGAVN